MRHKRNAAANELFSMQDVLPNMVKIEKITLKIFLHFYTSPPLFILPNMLKIEEITLKLFFTFLYFTILASILRILG